MPANGAPKKRGRRVQAPTIGQLGSVPVEELRQIVEKYDDAAFFGTFFQHVEERLRKPHAANNLSFYDAAKLLLQSRGFFQQAAAVGPLPPAAELLLAGQLEVLVERTLPDAAGLFQEKVVESLRAQLQAAGALAEDEGNEGDDAEAAA